MQLVPLAPDVRAPSKLKCYWCHHDRCLHRRRDCRHPRICCHGLEHAVSASRGLRCCGNWRHCGCYRVHCAVSVRQCICHGRPLIDFLHILLLCSAVAEVIVLGVTLQSHPHPDGDCDGATELSRDRFFDILPFRSFVAAMGSSRGGSAYGGSGHGSPSVASPLAARPCPRGDLPTGAHQMLMLAILSGFPCCYVLAEMPPMVVDAAIVESATPWPHPQPRHMRSDGACGPLPVEQIGLAIHPLTRWAPQRRSLNTEACPKLFSTAP